MKADVLENYIERVYGFAVNHTFSREEADELSQEILFTAVRELPKLKDCADWSPGFGELQAMSQKYSGAAWDGSARCIPMTRLNMFRMKTNTARE